MHTTLRRRSFIASGSAFAAMMLVEPTALSKPGISGRLLLDNDESYHQRWRGIVSDLIAKVIEDRDLGRELIRLVNTSPLYRAGSPTTFHETFCSPYLINARRSPAQTIQARWFEFNLRPMVDSENPCRTIKDLNLPEIARITHEFDVSGTLFSPCNQRNSTANATNAEYQDFCRTAKRYGVNPQNVSWLYTRPFTNGRKPHLGHAIATTNPPGGNSIPPTSSATSKDLLLSAESF